MDFLLEQAKRHVKYFPGSYGIAIDRGDWLRLYNDRADDGISYANNKKQRSLYISWHKLMEKLSDIMHGAGKVIYFNNHVKRLDHLRYIDGIFDEFGYDEQSMNMTGLLSMRMPAMGWIANKERILACGKDEYIQRYLYLGIHPMAPFPMNDHAMECDEEIERLYMDYGPIFDLMRGRKWLLEPECFEAFGCKANIFEVKEGYMLPAVLGGASASITLKKPELNDRSIYVYYPAENKSILFEKIKYEDNEFQFIVPLKRRCAILHIF